MRPALLSATVILLACCSGGDKAKGNTDAINSAMENIDGKLKQSMELMGPDGQPLAAAQTTVHVTNLQAKSLDELTKLFTDKIKG